MTKIDFRVVPVLCVMYLLAFLDRVNISNANVFGLSKELDLGGDEYNTCVRSSENAMYSLGRGDYMSSSCHF